jgi:hypothetical protein
MQLARELFRGIADRVRALVQQAPPHVRGVRGSGDELRELADDVAQSVNFFSMIPPPALI